MQDISAIILNVEDRSKGSTSLRSLIRLGIPREQITLCSCSAQKSGQDLFEIFSILKRLAHDCTKTRILFVTAGAQIPKDLCDHGLEQKSIYIAQPNLHPFSIEKVMMNPASQCAVLLPTATYRRLPGIDPLFLDLSLWELTLQAAELFPERLRSFPKPLRFATRPPNLIASYRRSLKRFDPEITQNLPDNTSEYSQLYHTLVTSAVTKHCALYTDAIPVAIPTSLVYQSLLEQQWSNLYAPLRYPLRAFQRGKAALSTLNLFYQKKQRRRKPRPPHLPTQSPEIER